ncbi:complex I NDUFA9 subunit family protein [Asticcacaulis sp. BYS171W]|uniref:Complex I NDUFA9 subunit family protein n=1 Tax=Asticcacaulis aquaticus TaxID=2984212 RepID=A0ABT5HRU2_9CAUL|nr:complex I NDUFA9 subunit family protein [Asticcacaulis aquaticus]MDC7682774.1 complex I NDUFA9 subunit family protein [Asticcacaulis aquaticus]
MATPFDTKLVTVFGGSGFVGKQVVRALAQRGWRVRVAVRKATYAYDLKPLGGVGQIQVTRCDVRKEADIAAALNGASAVVNLVGILYETPSQSFDELHRSASKAIAEAAAARGISDFVQISALGADAKSGSKYAASKGQAEAAVHKAIASAIIVRPSVVFGPQDGFFTSLAQQVKLFPLMPSIGGGKTKFQPVYVGDVARAVGEVLGNAAYAGQTFELGGPEVFTYNELVTYVGQEVQSPRPLVWMPVFAARLIALVGDVSSFLIKPLLTNDQVTLLQSDNIVTGKTLGFKDLAIAPTAVESVVPSYLWRFRKNGQFAEVVNG